MKLSLKALIVLTALFVLPIILFKPSAFLGHYTLSVMSYNYQANVTVVNAYFPPIVYPGAVVSVTLHNNEDYPVLVYSVEVNGVRAHTIPALPVRIPPRGNVTIYVEVPITSSTINVVVYV